MSNQNGGRRRRRGQLIAASLAHDPRIVYGTRCTWWGPVADAKFHKVVGVHYTPVCPECRGPLNEFANEEQFLRAVRSFEKGTYRGEVVREHPGYEEAMLWMKRRCFQDIRVGLAVYFTASGKTVELADDEFAEEKAATEPETEISDDDRDLAERIEIQGEEPS